MVSLESYAEEMADQARNLPYFKGFSLIDVKEKVANALDMIGRVNGAFVTYTKHDISHVNSMLEIVDWLIPPVTQKKMTSVDWLLIVLSIYYHDFGMIITSDEYNKRSENQLYQDFLQKIKSDNGSKDYIARTEKMTKEEKESFFYQEFVRSLHASRIREWITGSIPRYYGENTKILSDEIRSTLNELPIRFRQNLADICESHHKDNLDDGFLYPLCQRYGNKEQEIANVQYAALILRTADILHITRDRAPSVMYKIIRFSDPKSVDLWEKYSGTFSVHMKNRKFDENDPESLSIIISADFLEEKPFFSLSEYITYVNDQIVQSKRWADKSQKESNGEYYSFPWQGIKGDIRVEGNAPKQMKFDLDRGRLLDLLVGHTIYNDPTVAIRELLQNAIEAVRYEYYLKSKMKTSLGDQEHKMGRVIVKWDPEKRELIIEDNGIGMDIDVINYHLMRVGSSFYNTAQFQEENLDYVPISRFGIGVLTCFMMSDDIEIITCRKEGGYRIKMSSVQGTYLLKKLEPGHKILDDLEPHGTRVRLIIRESIDLIKQNVLDIIKHWIIFPDCKVIYKEKNQQEKEIGYKDPSDFLQKLISKEDMPIEVKTESKTIKGETYELSFAVGKNIYSPGRNFLFSSGELINLIGQPAICVEGIRMDDILPGFDDDNKLYSIFSIKGNKTLQTTVSRTNIERNSEYIRIGKICLELFTEYIKSEVKRISLQIGEPLSQASTASLRMCNRITSVIEDDDISDYFEELKKEIPMIVTEKTKPDNGSETSRNLMSIHELESLTNFWAIESRLVDSLGIMSRDLGRELSLNEFLGKLAPELLDPRINCILPDAHLFKNVIRSSHKLVKVEFSRKNQQSIMKWEIRNKSLSDDYITFKMSDYLPHKTYLKEYDDNFDEFNKFLVVIPIEGNIEKVRGINTRIVTILNHKSKIIDVLQVLVKALKCARFKLNEISINEYRNLISYVTNVIKLASWQISKSTFESDEYFFSVPSIYDNPRKRYSSRRASISEATFYEETLRINRLLDNLGIQERINLSLVELENEGIVFDASSYWLDWGTSVY